MFKKRIDIKTFLQSIIIMGMIIALTLGAYENYNTEYSIESESVSSAITLSSPEHSDISINSLYLISKKTNSSSDTIYVWRVLGDTEVYHTNRNCQYIKKKSDSQLKKLTIYEAENDQGLRKCKKCPYVAH